MISGEQRVWAFPGAAEGRPHPVPIMYKRMLSMIGKNNNYNNNTPGCGPGF